MTTPSMQGPRQRGKGNPASPNAALCLRLGLMARWPAERRGPLPPWRPLLRSECDFASAQGKSDREAVPSTTVASRCRDAAPRKARGIACDSAATWMSRLPLATPSSPRRIIFAAPWLRWAPLPPLLPTDDRRSAASSPSRRIAA